MDTMEVMQDLCPGAIFTEYVVLAYSGNARDRRRSMRSDERKIMHAVALHGFGTPRGNGQVAEIKVRGHVRRKID